MNKENFDNLCEQYDIKPDIALESPDICKAIALNDEEKITRLLALLSEA